jgi:hypothetical protein
VCENFIFYSPLSAGREFEAAEQPTFRAVRGAPLNSRRTSSVQIDKISSAPFLARLKETRRFKVIGVHMSSLGVCEDEVLVEKILELMESLKWAELDSNLDANAELMDRYVRRIDSVLQWNDERGVEQMLISCALLSLSLSASTQ